MAAPPSLITGVDFVTVFSTDLTAAEAFYGGVLGCEEGRSTETWVDFDCQGTIAVANPDRPKATYLFQLQRRMTGIALEEGIVLVGQRTNILRQLGISLPERRAGKMLHNSRARPARKSASACSANLSSLPLLASRSIT